MQKFFGFDSTIGVGRNFGFILNQPAGTKPPLLKTLKASNSEALPLDNPIVLNKKNT